MAGDWIKMRTDLYRDPKVSVMADILMDDEGDLAAYVDQHCQRNMTVTRNVTRNACVGALLSVWGVMRHRGVRIGDDLVCMGVGLWVLDDIADMPGFGNAMESTGWVQENDQGLIFPRFFDEYNVEPDGKNKSKNAERQARYRDRKRLTFTPESNVTSNVTRNVTVTPRIEESRVEDTHTHTHPLDDPNGLIGQDVIVPDHLREWFIRWLDWRWHDSGKKPPATLQEVWVHDLLSRGKEKAVSDLRFSIRKQGKNLLDSGNDFEKNCSGKSGLTAGTQGGRKLTNAEKTLKLIEEMNNGSI